MNESAKTLAIMSKEEVLLLSGRGIDIGCGSSPVVPNAEGFDIANGDANFITKYVTPGIYNFVFSSHCLEHMVDPHLALFEWWKLVKPGGHMIVVVPDEDLYEQGNWPSIYNPDHKWTFTLKKEKSWSPKSINILDIASDYSNYKGASIVKVALQDNGFDYSLKGVDQTRGSACAQIIMILKKR